MDELRLKHNEAMDLAQMAHIASQRGETEKAEAMFRQAFEKEREVAITAYTDQYPQPGLSILLQSAAHLAVTCKQTRDAEKIIGLVLSGDAPSEIRHDLRCLLSSLDQDTEGEYETYAIQLPAGDKGILNALDVMLNRLGCSMKKIAVL
ncbi:MAG: hypothetical protein MJZ12_02505 [Prevotella sp.]|nr:hypothetical protein [Prevotella sp.]